jgi:uncharacterized membrane protein HdeD (DUF308 family)
MIKIVKAFQATHIRNKWLTIMGSLLLILVIMTAMYGYESAWITTQLGALLVALSCFLLLMTNVRSLADL